MLRVSPARGPTGNTWLRASGVLPLAWLNPRYMKFNALILPWSYFKSAAYTPDRVDENGTIERMESIFVPKHPRPFGEACVSYNVIRKTATNHRDP